MRLISCCTILLPLAAIRAAASFAAPPSNITPVLFVARHWTARTRARSTRTSIRMAAASSSSMQDDVQQRQKLLPGISAQIQSTLDPCVVLMKAMIGKHAAAWEQRGGIYSLAQGVVYWRPPETSQAALVQAMASTNNDLHLYGPDEGLPELRAALQRKVATENGLPNHEIMVTVGANQAYVNCVLTLLSSSSLSQQHKAVFFKPYYFNHVMAAQMTIGNDRIVIGPVSSQGLPDLDWLEATLAADPSIHLVTLANPGNPTGVVLDRPHVQAMVDVCRIHNCWLVLDATYEYFTNPPAPAFDACFDEPHVLHIFSFSKAYAMAGYRCGYIAISNEATTSTTTTGDTTDTTTATPLFASMLKVQDTVPIAPSRVAQICALGALEAGPDWVRRKVATLATGRQAIRRALSPLQDEIMGGSGAMYFMAKLPPEQPLQDDVALAEQLVSEYGVAVIPGSYCGFPGWIRVCYSNLPPDQCVLAAERLQQGLEDFVNGKW